MINRYQLVSRHNPILKEVDFESPLSVGNGEFAYTADVTGMQTLYKEQEEHHVPLCTMSQWGWHTTPVSQHKYRYTMEDVQMTSYEYDGRQVSYAVEMKEGNEEVYNWLRHNPHRLNLARIGFVFNGEQIKTEAISHVRQELKLYEGIIESTFCINNLPCQVITVCDDKQDAVGFQIASPGLADGSLQVQITFPYGSSDITASDWSSPQKHQTAISLETDSQLVLKRILDRDSYYVKLQSDEPTHFDTNQAHTIILTAVADRLAFTARFSKEPILENLDTQQIIENSRKSWEKFWEEGGAIELSRSKDQRANELERRIVLSQYILAIQSCGSMPPQETGLTCNSWYGKFHLEMHLWHSACFPLWQRPQLLERSLPWYKEHLTQAKANAARNGFKGAKWPKMVAYDAIDSPSWIATLLIWQQPHIIYMLELIYQNHQENNFLQDYWEVIKETADFMCDYTVYNERTGKYDLKAPIIPAQEEHQPMDTLNPTFEVAYWSFALKAACQWAKRLGHSQKEWETVAENMAELPEKDGLYLAHENCPQTFEAFNKDHPSMVGAFGLISSDSIVKQHMMKTLDKVLECWDFSTMWGWDFAMMAMTAVRLGEREKAIDILLKDTPKNSYVASGNNYQRLRTDLPLYLPGNGSLLLAAALMTAGYGDCKEKLPGFPENGMWEVEFENINPFPY